MIGVLARCIGRTERSASKLLLLPNTSSTSNLRSCQHRAHTRTSRISRRSQCRESLPKQGLPFVRDHGFASAHQERMQVGDTIYALATASGRAAIAIVRVSGPGCSEVVLTNLLPPMAKTSLRSIRHCVQKLHSQDPGVSQCAPSTTLCRILIRIPYWTPVLWCFSSKVPSHRQVKMCLSCMFMAAQLSSLPL